MKTAVPIPFHITDWSQISVTEHAGETGMALWKTLQFGNLRVRQVEYTAGYLADHWCCKGHIIYCLEGEIVTELSDGSKYILKQGMSYQVSDEESRHRSFSATGTKLFIIDGDFLQWQQPITRGIWM